MYFDNTLNGILSLPLLIANLSLVAGIHAHNVDRATTGPSSTYQTRFPNVTWNHSAWQLRTTLLDQGHYQSRMSLSNGYIGINVAALGPFFDVDLPVDNDVLSGWPLFDRRQSFATVAGFWDSQPDTNGTNFPWLLQYGGESVISGLPHWAGISLSLDADTALHATTPASQIRQFTSSLDMKRALLSWSYVWSPPSHSTFNVSYDMFLHKVYINQAFVRMTVTPTRDTSASIVNILDGDCATRTTFAEKGLDGDFLFSSVRPQGIDHVLGYVYTNMTISGPSAPVDATWNASYIGKNQSSIAGASHVALKAGQTIVVTKYVGIASSDAFANPRDVARSAAQTAMRSGFDASFESHAAEWSQVFPTTSVDDFTYAENGTLPDDEYIIEAAIMAVANPFYLLQNTISESANSTAGSAPINSHSVPVGGLGSDAYAGQIFWDAEVWMQPGLAVTFPFAAKGIANYRVERFAQAQKNIQTAYQSSKNKTVFSKDGAIFPWTSARRGNCTATGPCFDYEYHINGDIALSLLHYYLASGDTKYFEDRILPIMNSVSTMFSDLLERNGSFYSLTNMTDPDEFANNVDNGGFTMPLITDVLFDTNVFRERLNQPVVDRWNDQAQNVLVSTNQNVNIILEYTGMNNSICVKQADVVLVSYPLSYQGTPKSPFTAQTALASLDYYANKQSPDGPGMTYSIFSIVASDVSPSGCSAYTYQAYSTQPYARAPWFQLSEQLLDNYEENGGFHPAFPFLTGHGGANQVVLFGYLGLRLLPDGVLHVNPSLPPQVPRIRYRIFHWHGWPIQAYANQTHTTLRRDHGISPASGAFPDPAFASVAIPVAVGAVPGNLTMYQLPANGSLTVSNRYAPQNLSIPGNAVQCRPAFTNVETVPGQFAISAVDGASSTKFQPLYANRSAQLTVHLPLGKHVRGFRFEWGDAPAYNYSIFFHNDSIYGSNGIGLTTAQTVIRDAKVAISHPFNAAEAATVAPVRTNVSEVWFNGTQTFTTAVLEVLDLWTSRYATMEIWGSLYNSSLTVANMSGKGATVAEWVIIAD